MAELREPIYERIGATYSAVRIEDPRIASQVHRALGPARSILNVGAGTGSYEPSDRDVVAIEPSSTMLRQRGPGRAPAIQATAEALPLATSSFDAAMAVLTLHHWTDRRRGLLELRRVSHRQVVFFFEPLASVGFWLLHYFPEIAELPNEAHSPGVELIADVLDLVAVDTVPVPRDCSDGFAAAYWARPEAYLDPVVQAGISSMAMLPDDVRAAGSIRLGADLASGRWDERFGHLRTLDSFDGGYRLAIAGH